MYWVLLLMLRREGIQKMFDFVEKEWNGLDVLM